MRKASDEGRRIIMLRGDDAVVVFAVEESGRITRKPKGTLVEIPSEVAVGCGCARLRAKRRYRQARRVVSYLLDTGVLSEMVRPRLKASVVGWVLKRNEDDLFLSVITIEHLKNGIAKLPDLRSEPHSCNGYAVTSQFGSAGGCW